VLAQRYVRGMRPRVRLYPFDCNPLDLTERDFIAGATVEFGRAWTYMRGHGLGVLQCATGFEMGVMPMAQNTERGRSARP
jgi:hypothetical protein